MLQLGKKLVEELGIGERVDTLGRWMSHYVADLIHAADTAIAEDRTSKLAQCAEAILALWKHRHQFLNIAGPLEDFGPVLRALESLDPSDSRPRYFRSVIQEFDSVIQGAGELERESETMDWFKRAKRLDYSARLLIGYCIARAAESAADSSRNWVSLAEAAGIGDDVELHAIRLIRRECDRLKPTDPNEEERKRIEDQIDRLHEFKEAAVALASDLQGRLDQMDGPSVTSP